MTITRANRTPGLLYFTVVGDSGREYAVTHVRRNHQRRWFCQCNDFSFRQVARRRHCKHIHHVRESLRIAKSEVAA